MTASPEISADQYLYAINDFVGFTALATQLQLGYLGYLRPSMSERAALHMQAKIGQSASANAEALGQAWIGLAQLGWQLRTRHPETGRIAPVLGIGIDSSGNYQTKVPGYEEPWPLIGGDQLHI